MHGYRVLRDNNQLGLVRKLKRELADTRFAIIIPVASHFFFGAGKEHASLIVKQYLLTRYTGVALNKELLYSIGSGNSKITYPLPREFRLVLVNNGFNISHWRSSLAWIVDICLLWCFGMLSIGKHLYQSLRGMVAPALLSTGNYVFFIGLHKNNLPRPCKDGRSHEAGGHGDRIQCA